MKAVVWLGPRQMALQNVPQPEPAADEVLLAIDSVGICGSELSGYLGQNSLRVPPLIMGHEFAGRVTVLGADVTKLHTGDRVTVNPLIGCGTCAACRQGLENICPQRQIIGIHRPGAFADVVAVPAANCTLLPDDMSFVAGALAEPLACGVRTTVVGGVTAGSRVLVIGAGAIGLMCIAAVQHAGGDVVLAADVNAGRLAAATRWGAAATCDARSSDTVATAREVTAGIGADVVIDAVGTTETRRAAVDAVRLGGTVVFIGLHEGESMLQANQIIRSETRIAGSFCYTKPDFAQAVSMLRDGMVQPSADWLEERDLEECDDAFAELIDDPPAVAKIMLRTAMG